MQEGTILEWTVGEGDTVKTGQVIYRLETDKVEMDIEAPVSGVIHIMAPAGSAYPVGAPVATIEP
jgi:pyruvate/2-oxoglutarate dehydrogenase complex dihydrolipoamide acyltransferase (E2) component